MRVIFMSASPTGASTPLAPGSLSRPAARSSNDALVGRFDAIETAAD
jgi:hypothetical protein